MDQTSELVEVVTGDTQTWADKLNDEWRSTVDGIIGIGRMLAAAKAELPHGEFGRLFPDHDDSVERPFILKSRAAQTLIKVAEHPVLANPHYNAHLPPAWTTLAALTRLDDVLAEIDAGHIHPGMGQADANKLVAKHRFEKRKETFQAAAATEGDRWNMIHDDFRNITFDEPVDAILTDPPYPDEFLPLWEDLAEWGNKVLRPGGILIAWSGQKRLPEILSMMTNHLRYGWTMALDLPGSQSKFLDGNMYQTWKPILVFVKDKWPPHDWGPDRLESPQREKGRYEWEQSVEPAIAALDRFVSPGGLVVDPFCGVGSFGVAALRSGRRFVGIEIDNDRHDESATRLTEC